MAAKYPGVVRLGMKPRMTRGQAPSRPAVTTPVRLSPKDEHIFRDLMERFAVLSEMCFRFSQDIVFGDRFIEILATIYLKKAVDAQELATILGDFPKTEMSRKLRVLESAGLVERGHSFEDPDSARYSLTHKGTVIARLGEPVFLYLRLAEGWTTDPAKDRVVTATEGADQSGEYEAAPRT